MTVGRRMRVGNRLVLAETRFSIRQTLPSLLGIATLIAISATLWPVLIDGVDQTRGPVTGVVAGGAFAAAGTLIGPALVLLSVGRGYDQGLTDARFLAGLQRGRLAWAQLLSALIVSTLGVGLAALLGGIAGTADWGARAMLRHRIDVESGVAVGALFHNLQGLLVFTVVTWLVVVAVRSGRRGLVALLVAVASLMIGLTRLDDPARMILQGHPLMLIWSATDPFPAESLRLTPEPAGIAASSLWLALLIGAAVRQLRR